MPDERAFLATIAAEPEDDTVRLVYADWLEERGDPRGEFVRVQCRLARSDESDPHSEELRLRERALLDAHRLSWLGPLTEWGTDWRFRRGFVAAGTLGVWSLLENGEGLSRSAPLLEEVSLHHVKYALQDVRHARPLSGIRSLTISPAADDDNERLGDDDVDSLAVSPLLAGVEELSLRGNGIGIPGWVTLLNSPRLARLVSLDLSRNSIRSLAWYAPGGGSPYIPQLERTGPALEVLNLSHNDITGLEWDWLVPVSAKLRVLNLSNTDQDGWGLRQLADASPGFPGLKELNLSHNPRLRYDWSSDHEQLPAHVEGSALWSQMEVLDLSFNAFDSDAAEMFLRHPEYMTDVGWRDTVTYRPTAELSSIRLLDLRGNNITEERVRRELIERYGDRVKL